MFEIRIDDVVSKWSGSVEIGVTIQSPERFDFPETLSRAKTVFSLGDLEHLQVCLNARRRTHLEKDIISKSHLEKDIIAELCEINDVLNIQLSPKSF